MPDDSWFDFTDWTPTPTPKLERHEKLAEAPIPRTKWTKSCYLCLRSNWSLQTVVPQIIAYETCDIAICDTCLHLAAPLKW